MRVLCGDSGIVSVGMLWVYCYCLPSLISSRNVQLEKDQTYCNTCMHVLPCSLGHPCPVAAVHISLGLAVVSLKRYN